MRLLSRRFGNEARSKWLLEVARFPHLVDGALSDYRRFTYAPGSLAAKTCRETLWVRLFAELGHQPHPLAPVLVVKNSVALRKTGYRSVYMDNFEAQQQHSRLLEDVPTSEPTLLA